MAKGWIKLHRQLQDCWLWNDEPFSKGQAWVDLLLTANHEDKKIFFNGELRTIMKGQMLTSVVKLSNRWQWSRGKTRRFLNILETDGMVTLECNRGGASNGTLLTIEKYEVYQYSGTTDEPTDDTTNGQRTVQRSDINKNDKNDKEINNNNRAKKFAPPSLEEVHAYCLERKNNINAQTFIDFYSSKGWMIGKNKMKDWKAAIRTWEGKDRTTPKKDPSKGMLKQDYNFEDLEKRLLGQ